MRAYACLTSGIAILAGALLAPAPPSRAGEAAFCVTCSAPSQTYLCRVTGAAVTQTDALKLYCIMHIAKDGRHASCGARNDVAGCQGDLKVYAYEGPSLPAHVGQAIEANETIEEGTDESFDAQPKNETSKTLADTYAASRRGIRNMRNSLRGESGREEPPPVAAAAPAAASQGAMPADALPASAAASGTLPELPGASPSPLSPGPIGMTHGSPTEAAVVPPDAVRASPAPEASTGRIRRSAQSVGKFAKKSYRRVRSLFFRCREQAQVPAAN
jgi:hypothetical protein